VVLLEKGKEILRREFQNMFQRLPIFSNLAGQMPVMHVKDNLNAVGRDRKTAEQIAVKWRLQNEQ
jgi:hypothetical protein